MSSRAHLIEFTFKDDEYMVGITDAPGVRIGRIGEGPFFDVPRGHAWFDRIREANTRAAVEDLHDELMSAYA